MIRVGVGIQNNTMINYFISEQPQITNITRLCLESKKHEDPRSPDPEFEGNGQTNIARIVSVGKSFNPKQPKNTYN